MYEVWSTYYNRELAIMDVDYITSFDTYEEAAECAMALAKYPNVDAYVCTPWFEA